MIKTFTDFNYEVEVLHSDKLAVVHIWAVWSPLCMDIKRSFDRIAPKYTKEVNLGRLNIDENPGIPSRYNIKTPPAILFIKNGQVIEQTGFIHAQVLEKKMQQYM